MAAADVNVAVEGERAKTVGRTRSIVLSELPRHVSGLLEVYDTSATPQPSPQFVPNRLHSPQKKQPQFPAHPLWGCRGGASLGATRVARAPPVWPSSAPAARRVASPHRGRRRLRRKHHMAQTGKTTVLPVQPLPPPWPTRAGTYRWLTLPAAPPAIAAPRRHHYQFHEPSTILGYRGSQPVPARQCRISGTGIPDTE